jgi:putative transposase
VKYAWIDANRDRYGVSRLCRVLCVSRSGYCQWRVRGPSARALRRIEFDAHVAAAHTRSRGTYGRARLVKELNTQGVKTGAERVRRSLVRQQLRPVYRRRWLATTDSAHRLPVAPNVLDRRFDGWDVNQAWVSDITYLPTAEGWLYLAAILDLGSRRIVGWSMSERIDAELVSNALRSAYWQRRPGSGLILHSDRGSQYGSWRYREMVSQYQMTMSMSRRANAWDNAPMESFFKTLKVEQTSRCRYETRAQARLDVVDWIEGFYNRQRIHSSIGYRTPCDYETAQIAA